MTSQMFVSNLAALLADDAKLCHTIVDDSDSSMLEHSCQLLFDWSDEWCMKLNTEKCKVLSIVKNTRA